MEQLIELPNIFDYATSELSQDAFICYLLAFGMDKYKKAHPREFKIAHLFLEKCGIPADEEILEIKKQYLDIDVLAVTSSHFLIIEDKTGTKEHSNQIVKYVKALKNSALSSGRKIKVCYLKTLDYVRSYETSDKTVLPQCDCCSLRRKDMLDLLKTNPENNLIFESFYNRLDNIEKRIKNCDNTEIRTWCKEKWFDYLSSALDGHNFNIVWVHNPKGGFYACYFDWENCGKGENYKQIEISFIGNITSEVKLCLKFSSDSKEITRNSKPLIKDLQNAALTKNYISSNRTGRTTTYAYRIAKNKTDIQEFINQVL